MKILVHGINKAVNIHSVYKVSSEKHLFINRICRAKRFFGAFALFYGRGTYVG